ncbi:MAG: glycosyltransferase, partial [Candidatus Dadabacteria bacterium]
MAVMKDDILVSVVICTYNGAAYLQEQLASIINQTHKNLEIIISDDVSTDNTLEIARQLSKQDNRIRIYENNFKLGIKKNFETALQYA